MNWLALYGALVGILLAAALVATSATWVVCTAARHSPRAAVTAFVGVMLIYVPVAALAIVAGVMAMSGASP